MENNSMPAAWKKVDLMGIQSCDPMHKSPVYYHRAKAPYIMLILIYGRL
jgi:hypothetical protein